MAAFASVVIAYQFMSLTWSTTLPKTVLGLALDSPNDIAICFLLYSTILLPAAAAPRLLLALKKQPAEEGTVLHALAQATNSSMLFVISVVTLTLVLNGGADIHRLSHLAFWVLWAEVNRIICGTLKKWSFFQSAALFGTTIQVLVVAAQVLAVVRVDFFQFL